MTDRELMQMALDALDKYGFMPLEDEIGWQHFKKTIEALRVRLAQPEQEPVAWFMEGTFMDGTPSFIQVCETDPEFYTPLYTAPPQREWQGLTDEEFKWIVCKNHNPHTQSAKRIRQTIKEIEDTLKEKNT